MGEAARTGAHPAGVVIVQEFQADELGVQRGAERRKVLQVQLLVAPGAKEGDHQPLRLVPVHHLQYS